MARQPDYAIKLEGKDLTSRFEPRLISLTITENRADESDTFDIELSDHDGKLAIPEKGMELAVSIGWTGKPLVNKGTYKVDEVEHSGAPDTLRIRARSASMTREMGSRRERSWHSKTIAQIVRTIADEHKLTPVVGNTLGATAIPHIDQTHESDMAFLTRLARRYDAVMTVKEGRLLFMPIGEATTASGQALPAISITRQSGDQHRYHVSEREKYSGVRAYYHSGGRGKRKDVVVGGEDNHSIKTLPITYPSEGEARDAATAELKRCQRGQATMEYTLALGVPELRPEAPVNISGFKPVIDEEDWLVKRATHSIGQGGYITSIELELRDDPTSKRHRSNFRRT